jgi:hypothetical protein
VTRARKPRREILAAESKLLSGHGPVPATWFGVGQWPTCRCGLAPRDNGQLMAHWRTHGVEVVDDHGQLVVSRTDDAIRAAADEVLARAAGR